MSPLRSPTKRVQRYEIYDEESVDKTDFSAYYYLRITNFALIHQNHRNYEKIQF